MGNADSNTTHEVVVHTGDKKGANVRNVNVFMVFTDERGNVSEKMQISGKCQRFHEGKEARFEMELPGLTKITEFTISRDGSSAHDTWYVERLDIMHIVMSLHTNEKTVKTSIFPVNRWINADSELSLTEFDSLLPQFDKNKEQREKELRVKREEYVLSEKIAGAPPLVEILPDNEKFTNEYLFDLAPKAAEITISTAVVDMRTPEFTSIADVESIFNTRDKGHFPCPKGLNNWRSDEEFGNQKLAGVCPNIIELCPAIPSNFDATPALLQAHLEGKKLDDVIASKRLYKIDLGFLEGIECSDGRMLPGPTCILYVKDSGDLVPIAIQLMPTIAPDNPVFTPSDSEYTWLAAKLWFNLADCSYHQSVTHLGFTHLLIESVAVCSNRQLSPSHPMFRLLCPHFLYVMNINALAVNQLIQPGGWVDKTMQIGRTGMFNIIAKKWAVWNLKEDGNLLTNLVKRGVDDADALPKYHYRDDATLMWCSVNGYVTEVVSKVYDTADKLSGDNEIQAWVKELANGASFKGLPAQLTSNDDLIEILTVFIFISSVQHAAANFGQYDEYAFAPNYPAIIRADRPTTKKPLDEDYIVRALPTKRQLLDMATITKILSEKATNELGNFEIEYAFDSISYFALQRFKADLHRIYVIIEERNVYRERKYPFLDPREVPNAISI